MNELKTEVAEEPMVDGIKVSDMVKEHGEQVEIVFGFAVEANSKMEEIKAEYTKVAIEREGYLEKLRTFLPKER